MCWSEASMVWNTRRQQAGWTDAKPCDSKMSLTVKRGEAVCLDRQMLLRHAHLHTLMTIFETGNGVTTMHRIAVNSLMAVMLHVKSHMHGMGADQEVQGRDTGLEK